MQNIPQFGRKPWVADIFVFLQLKAQQVVIYDDDKEDYDY